MQKKSIAFQDNLCVFSMPSYSKFIIGLNPFQKLLLDGCEARRQHQAQNVQTFRFPSPLFIGIKDTYFDWQKFNFAYITGKPLASSKTGQNIFF